MKDTLPDDWPTSNGVGSPGMKGSQLKSRDGLALGVKIVIVLVALIIVGILALFILQKRRSSGGEPEKEIRRKTSVNAAKDPSQALQLEADGRAFHDVVKSNVSTPQSEDFDFEAPGAMSVEVERPKTPTNHFASNGGSGGGGRGRGRGGHGRII